MSSVIVRQSSNPITPAFLPIQPIVSEPPTLPLLLSHLSIITYQMLSKYFKACPLTSGILCCSFIDLEIYRPQRTLLDSLFVACKCLILSLPYSSLWLLNSLGQSQGATITGIQGCKDIVGSRIVTIRNS